MLDGLGHTRLLLDSSGNITDRYSYDAWGNPIEQVGTTFNPFRWNAAYGYEWTPAIGLYHVGAREYDPRTARWLQKDPIDIASGDPNLYRYCGNDPINAKDPSGLDWLDDAANFFAGVGDSLTFGATDWVREQLGVNAVVDKCSTAYRVGEYTEVAAEITLTGGSKLLTRMAVRKGMKMYTEYRRVAGALGVKAPLGNQVHHINPLLGHPGGSRTLFPTGGLPGWVHSGRWNLQVLEGAAHTLAHRRLRRLERWLRINTNRYTITLRLLNNLRRDSEQHCGE